MGLVGAVGEATRPSPLEAKPGFMPNPPSVPSQGLRGRTKGPQERAAHAFAVRKTCFLRNHFGRMCPASIMNLAASSLICSTALAGDWRVSARNARLNWRGLRLATAASSSIVSAFHRFCRICASTVSMRSDFGVMSSSAECCL